MNEVPRVFELLVSGEGKERIGRQHEVRSILPCLGYGLWRNARLSEGLPRPVGLLVGLSLRRLEKDVLGALRGNANGVVPAADSIKNLPRLRDARLPDAALADRRGRGVELLRLSVYAGDILQGIGRPARSPSVDRTGQTAEEQGLKHDGRSGLPGLSGPHKETFRLGSILFLRTEKLHELSRHKGHDVAKLLFGELADEPVERKISQNMISERTTGHGVPCNPGDERVPEPLRNKAAKNRSVHIPKRNKAAELFGGHLGVGLKQMGNESLEEVAGVQVVHLDRDPALAIRHGREAAEVVVGVRFRSGLRRIERKTLQAVRHRAAQALREHLGNELDAALPVRFLVPHLHEAADRGGLAARNRHFSHKRDGLEDAVQNVNRPLVPAEHPVLLFQHLFPCEKQIGRGVFVKVHEVLRAVLRMEKHPVRILGFLPAEEVSGFFPVNAPETGAFPEVLHIPPGRVDTRSLPGRVEPVAEGRIIAASPIAEARHHIAHDGVLLRGLVAFG